LDTESASGKIMTIRNGRAAVICLGGEPLAIEKNR
jgi:hypothetical protein